MLVLPVWTQVESKKLGKSPLCATWGSGYIQSIDLCYNLSFPSNSWWENNNHLQIEITSVICVNHTRTWGRRVGMQCYWKLGLLLDQNNLHVYG